MTKFALIWLCFAAHLAVDSSTAVPRPSPQALSSNVADDADGESLRQAAGPFLNNLNEILKVTSSLNRALGTTKNFLHKLREMQTANCQNCKPASPNYDYDYFDSYERKKRSLLDPFGLTTKIFRLSRWAVQSVFERFLGGSPSKGAEALADIDYLDDLITRMDKGKKVKRSPQEPPATDDTTSTSTTPTPASDTSSTSSSAPTLEEGVQSVTDVLDTLEEITVRFGHSMEMIQNMLEVFGSSTRVRRFINLAPFVSEEVIHFIATFFENMLHLVDFSLKRVTGGGRKRSIREEIDATLPQTSSITDDLLSRYRKRSLHFTELLQSLRQNTDSWTGVLDGFLNGTSTKEEFLQRLEQILVYVKTEVGKLYDQLESSESVQEIKRKLQDFNKTLHSFIDSKAKRTAFYLPGIITPDSEALYQDNLKKTNGEEQTTPQNGLLDSRAKRSASDLQKRLQEQMQTIKQYIQLPLDQATTILSMTDLIRLEPGSVLALVKEIVKTVLEYVKKVVAENLKFVENLVKILAGLLGPMLENWIVYF